MNPINVNENKPSTSPKSDTKNNPIRPNLADSSINQEKHDLEKSNSKEKEHDQNDETDPEKEYIAGEKEGDFPPDIKMNSSLSEGSEFDTDEGTVGQQAVKEQQAKETFDRNSKH